MTTARAERFAQDIEQKESRARSRAAAALSGIHLLQGDLEAAGACAEAALHADPGNAQALLNKVGSTSACDSVRLQIVTFGGKISGNRDGNLQGNIVSAAGDHALARELFAEAAARDSSCLQAHYNHG